jgi:hypothetical protein
VGGLFAPIAIRTDRRHFARFMDRRVRIGADGSVVLEHFRFSSNRENALSPCFYAFPDGKPLRTFPGNALDEQAGQNFSGRTRSGGR